MRRIELPARIEDVAAAQRWNAALHEGTATLDWRGVGHASEAALRALLGGLDLESDADILGFASIPAALEARVGALLEQEAAVRARERRPRQRPARPVGAEPAVFRAPRPSERALPAPAAGAGASPATTPPQRPSAGATPAATPEAVRAHLLRALEADLIGPFDPETGAETLRLAPTRWYQTGFLGPLVGRANDDPDDEDDLASGSDETREDGDDEPSTRNKQRQWFPASIGLSVLVPRGTTSLTAHVRFGRYETVREPSEDGSPRKGPPLWKRMPFGPVAVTVPLDAAALRAGVRVPGAPPEVKLTGHLEEVDGASRLSPGTRAVTLFLVNGQRADGGEKGQRDTKFLFQVGFDLECPGGFEPRPNRRDEDAGDHDARVADLQFRNRAEAAVGHGVSAAIRDRDPADPRRVTRVGTEWLPTAEVRRVRPRSVPGVEVRMARLAELSNGDAFRAALAPMVEAYGAWLREQGEIALDSERRRKTRDGLLARAEHARQRIADGIRLLGEDDDVRAAFALMNRAMAASARAQRPDGAEPEWRLFQLAFVLANLRGVADGRHPDRATVELIFFPTGGGKTEAYLGVIAFTLLLRRLRGRERPDGGLGVAVLLRYTLRLLTLDQLARAATLMCALEVLRREDPARLGSARFSVGLWVGSSATANTLKVVKQQICEYKASTGPRAESPFPLTHCPWCREVLGKDSIHVVDGPAREPSVVVGCTSYRCEFSARSQPDGLPVVFVDEQIYRELPGFVIGTVDKFAMMPWRGETGGLFGRVGAMRPPEGRSSVARFYGPMDGTPGAAERLPEGLEPPELIVQDELHLISGPLGTMVGLYETAIEWLARRPGPDGEDVLPKVLASTATVRRAAQQIQALFGRHDVAVFPPPAVDESETWFAQVENDAPGRLYVGVAGQGRSMKSLLLRTYTALLGGAYRQHDPARGASSPADPYLTLAGYFNSLRELGGMRRLVEDDVRSRTMRASQKHPEGVTDADHPWQRDRTIGIDPLELTSRRNAGEIKRAKAQLAEAYESKAGHVDVLLASNMISVGVDIDRLGLMVVAGQPKTTAEYIQASSRVGRRHPGLVVTVLNLAKPRDRSHYERFAAYHESFYRFVEANSLTPFSGPALDRGLAGTLVAMARLGEASLTPPGGVMHVTEHKARALAAADAIAARVGRAFVGEEDGRAIERLASELRARARSLVDAWEQVMARSGQEAGGGRVYSRFDRSGNGKPLLYMVVDDDQQQRDGDELKFAAPTSMRDVEPTAHLWVQRIALGAG